MELLVPVVFGSAAEKPLEYCALALVPKLGTILERERTRYFEKPPKPNFEDMVLGKMQSVFNVLETVSNRPSSSSLQSNNKEHTSEDKGKVPIQDVEDNFQKLYDAMDMTEVLKNCYEGIEEFIIHSILADSTKYNLDQNRLLSGLLVNYDEPFSNADVPTLEEKSLVFQLQERLWKNLATEQDSKMISIIYPSASTLLLPSGKLKTTLPSQIFQAVHNWLNISKIKIADRSEMKHLGNVTQFHRNTRNLIAFQATDNIFEAVSKILYGTKKYSELIQICAYQIIRERPEIVQKCLKGSKTKFHANLNPVRINVLEKRRLPLQLTTEVLSELIKKDIIVHIGTYSGGQTSIRFGNFPKVSPVHLMELDNRIYPLTAMEGVPVIMDADIPVIHAHALAPSHENWQLMDPTFKNFGKFGDEMKSFFEICGFCQEFQNKECGHVTREQWNAFTILRRTLLDNNIGRLNPNDIPIFCIDDNANDWLPQNLMQHFTVIKTEKDGQCLFSSCSFYLSQSYNLTLPLRRSTLIEFRRNRSLYHKYYKDGNIPKNDIAENYRILFSLTEWGNSFSLALLSRITNRKIIVFEPGNKHVTYDIAISSTKEFQPIFLFLTDNHFQPMIPKHYTPELIPSGKKNQFSIINKLDLNYILNVEHNYVKPVIQPMNRKQIKQNNGEGNSTQYQFQDSKVQLDTPSLLFEYESVISDQIQNPTKESSITSTVSSLSLPKEKQDNGFTQNIQSNSVQSSSDESHRMEKDKRPHRLKFPWNRSITEIEKTQLESVFSFNTDEERIESFKLKINELTIAVPLTEYSQDILRLLQLSTRNKIQKDKMDDFVLFTNCIISEIAHISTLDRQEDFIRAFVQRCTFDSFWNSNVVRVKQFMYKRKNPNLLEAKKKAKQMMNLQGKDLARELVIELLARANFSRSSITAYSNIIKVKMEEIARGKQRSGGLKLELDALFQKTREKLGKRQMPDYTFEGLIITHKLESEMRAKMSAQESINLNERLQSQELPDSIGQNFLDISVKTLLARNDEAEDSRLSVMQNEMTSRSVTDVLHEENQSTYQSNSNMKVDKFDFVVPWNDMSDKIVIDVSNDGRPTIVSASSNTSVTNMECLDPNNSFGSDVIQVTKAKTETTKTLPSDLKGESRDGSNTAHQNPGFNRSDINFISSGQSMEINKSYVGEQEPETESLDSVYIQPSYTDIESLSESSNISTLEKEDEAICAKEALAKQIFPEHILKFVPPENFLMIVSADEISKCYNFSSNKFIPGEWAQVVSKHITKNQGVCCFKTRHVPDYYTKKSSGFCVMSGYCGCSMNFKVKVPHIPNPNQSVVFEVESSGKFKLIQIKNCGRGLRGEDRRKMSERLVNSMPTKVLLENLSTASPLELLHNTTEQYSLESLQQLRHDTFKSSAVCLDPMSDLLAFSKETENLESESTIIKGFIHMVKESQSNVQIHMYTEMGLRFLSSQKSSSILYVDATGSSTFPVNNKQMLFYLAFLETKDNHIAPIASSLAHRGRAIDIADLFIKIKGDLSLIKRDQHTALSSVIVTDYSFAMISGVLQGANTMELRDYIVHASNVILGKTEFDEKRSVVFVCTSHILHSFSRLLRKHLPSTTQYKDIRNLSLHSMARLQSCTDLNSFQTTVSCIVECFGLQYSKEDKIDQNISILKNITEIEDNDVDAVYTDDVEDYNEHKLLREKSPFYKEFIELKHAILAKENSLDPINKLFCPVVVDLFEKFYCPYFQLFGSAILEKTGRHPKGSLTNGMVESEFNTIKNNFHRKQKLPFNLFIRQHYTYYTGRIREIFMPDSQRNRRIKKRNVRAEQRYCTQNVEEKWNRRKQRSRTNAYVGKNVFKLKLGKQSKKCTTTSQVKSLAKETMKKDALNGNISFYSPIIAEKKLPAKKKVTFQVQEVNTENRKEASAYKSEILEVPDDILANVGYFTIDEEGLPDMQFVSMRSNQLADLCDPTHCISLDEMNVMMRFAYSKIIRSDYIISDTYFVWKDVTYQTQDDKKNIDPRTSAKILHPLLINNHWVLLQMSKNEKKCIVYSTHHREPTFLNEISSEVLPLYMLPAENFIWDVQYKVNFPKHGSSSTSGIFVYESTKILLKGLDVTVEELEHMQHQRKLRTSIVRDLLKTTAEGEVLIKKDFSDTQLQKTLRLVHSMQQIIAQKQLQSVLTAKVETGGGAAGSNILSIQKSNINQNTDNNSENLTSTTQCNQSIKEGGSIDKLARVPYTTIDKKGLPNVDYLTLKSKQLCDMCDPNYWVADDTMDVMLKLALTESSNTDFVVSDVHFAWKQDVSHPNVKSRWQSLYKFEDVNIDNMDPRRSLKILHPLIIENHWVLLQIDKKDGECIVYDSLVGSRSAAMLQEIASEVLPLFTFPDELIEWRAEYAKEYPNQKDSSSCGIFVYESARLILKGEVPCKETLLHLRNQRQARVAVVRKLLQTTPEGKQVLSRVGPDDKKLEKSLKLIDEICKDVSQRHLQVESQGGNDAGTITSGTSTKNPVQQKPIEDIFHDDRTHTAGMQMLMGKVFGIGETNKPIRGSENIDELFRRLGWEKGSTSTVVSSNDFDIERELEEFDKSLRDSELDIKRKLVPNYAEKERIFRKHCEKIENLGESELTSICNNILPDLRGIIKEEIFSTRHQNFMQRGLDSSTSHQQAVVATFSDRQDFCVSMTLYDNFQQHKMKNILINEVDKYILYVLKPEALCRIYSLKCNVPLDFAEKELKY